MSSAIPGLTGDCSFFVAAVEDNKTDVDFALIIRAQLYNKTFVIMPIDINKKYDENGARSLTDSYKNGGIMEMNKAAKKITGIRTDRDFRGYEEITDYLINGSKENNILDFLADNVTVIMKQYLSSVNYENTDKLFNTLINNIDTDITASDYFSAKDCIKAFESTTFVFKSEF